MTDEAILIQLLSSAPRTAGPWEAFLKRFSNLMLKIIWQFDTDYDAAMEKYVYVCQKLAERDFAILRRYRELGKQSPRFTTWLAAVTHNLCIDAYRTTHGRRQLPRAILRLPEFDREVFRLYYWRGYSQEEIEHQTANMPERTATAVGEALERIQSARVFVHQRPELIPFDEQDVSQGADGPEDDFAEMLLWLGRWMDELNDQERMILKLWFWENMTGHEIAEAMEISPEHKVYTLLKKTISQLRERAVDTYAHQRKGNISG